MMHYCWFYRGQPQRHQFQTAFHHWLSILSDMRTSRFCTCYRLRVFPLKAYDDCEMFKKWLPLFYMRNTLFEYLVAHLTKRGSVSSKSSLRLWRRKRDERQAHWDAYQHSWRAFINHLWLIWRVNRLVREVRSCSRSYILIRIHA